MRQFVKYLWVAACAAIGAPAIAQSWSPFNDPYQFVQNQSYSLQFTQPGLLNFEGADIFIQYSNLVYEPVALLPGALASILDIPTPAPPMSLGGNRDEIKISIYPANPTTLTGVAVPAGVMFGVQFKVRESAPLGPSSANVSFNIQLVDPGDITAEPPPITGFANINANILAVPEPSVWISMVAGLGLVGIALVRSKRRAPA